MPTTIEILNLPNFQSSNILDESELTADAAPAQAVIGVLNIGSMVANDYLVLNPGEETSELRQINSGGVSGNAITFSANLSLQHRNHEKVIKLYGNQMKVYRAANIDGTTPSDTSFSNIGSVTIKPDQPFSQFTDSAGGNGFWYKFTYYNATSNQETDISLSEAMRGGGWGHYVSLDDIRAEAGLNESRRLDDTQIDTRRAEAESEIKGKLASAGYTLPLQTTAGVYYTPPIIENVARLLAAGMVLVQNFGTTKPSGAKDGKSKIDDARRILAEIQLNDLVLLDTNEQMLAKPNLVDGWPDDTTKDDGKVAGPIMTMDRVF